MCSGVAELRNEGGGGGGGGGRGGGGGGGGGGGRGGAPRRPGRWRRAASVARRTQLGRSLARRRDARHPPRVGLPVASPKTLSAIAVDWRYAIPNDVTQPNGPTHPVIYIGGDIGVFRSVNNGQSWTPFPDVADDHAVQDGGLLPNVPVTSLSLS